jgi:Tfp pilus tip-associated adhesin PilY1
MAQMGQSWSIPSPMLVKGYSTDVNNPLIIMGAGYDTCDDQDLVPNTACASRRGNAVYVLNANTGQVLKTFTDPGRMGSVPSDITLVDRDFDGFADHAYFADTLGNLYRIDFVDPAAVATTRAPADWKLNRIGYTTGGNRKFLFGPAVLPSTNQLFIANTSGNRERPLIGNNPYASAKGGPVVNRAYMLIDDLSVTTNLLNVTTGTAVDMDSSTLANTTSASALSCVAGATAVTAKRGWRFDLNSGTGEQGVTSTTIFGGLVFFSTNRPVTTVTGACQNSLGEARGYAVNLLTSSGAVGTEALCGANRSGIFVGGGLPPSPVTGVVPVGGRPVTVMIGGIQRTGATSSPIGSQRVKPVISQKRSRIYWYRDGDK